MIQSSQRKFSPFTFSFEQAEKNVEFLQLVEKLFLMFRNVSLKLSTQFPFSLAFLAHLGCFLVQEVETLRPPFGPGCGSYPTTEVKSGQVWSVDRPGQEK